MAETTSDWLMALNRQLPALTVGVRQQLTPDSVPQVRALVAAIPTGAANSRLSVTHDALVIQCNPRADEAGQRENNFSTPGLWDWR
jgi:hypothetical protein